MKLFRTTSTGYRIFKPFFWFILLIFVVWGFGVAKSYNFNFKPMAYVVCEEEICPNPLLPTQPGAVITYSDFAGNDYYDLMENCKEFWCTQEYLTKGEYGTKPIDTNVIYFLFGLLVVIFLVLNHFCFNRGKKFDLGLTEYWQSQLKFLKKIEEWDE